MGCAAQMPDLEQRKMSPLPSPPLGLVPLPKTLVGYYDNQNLPRMPPPAHCQWRPTGVRGRPQSSPIPQQGLDRGDGQRGVSGKTGDVPGGPGRRGDAISGGWDLAGMGLPLRGCQVLVCDKGCGPYSPTHLESVILALGPPRGPPAELDVPGSSQLLWVTFFNGELG